LSERMRGCAALVRRRVREERGGVGRRQRFQGGGQLSSVADRSVVSAGYGRAYHVALTGHKSLAERLLRIAASISSGRPWASVSEKEGATIRGGRGVTCGRGSGWG